MAWECRRRRRRSWLDSVPGETVGIGKCTEKDCKQTSSSRYWTDVLSLVWECRRRRRRRSWLDPVPGCTLSSLPAGVPDQKSSSPTDDDNDKNVCFLPRTRKIQRQLEIEEAEGSFLRGAFTKLIDDLHCITVGKR